MFFNAHTPTTRKQFISLLLAAALSAALPVHARSVQDVKGQTVQLPEQVNRVADLWHANNQVVLLLGGGDKLVATTDVVHNYLPWFAKVYPRIKNVPVLTNGQSVQSEALLKVRPDAVLVSSPSMQQQVQKAGMKAVLVSFQDFNGLRKTVRTTAAVLGGNAPKVAEQYIAELDGNIRFVSERLKGLPETAKPRVLHIGSAQNLTQVDGGKSIIGEWIKLAGGRNALPDTANKAGVNMEDIMRANPEVIIIGGRNAAAGVAKIKQSPAWRGIAAVKNNRIYVNPIGTFGWDRYSAEEALQVLWAAKTLHPDRFKDVDLAAKTQAFYQKYYRYPLSKADAQRIVQGLDPQ